MERNRHHRAASAQGVLSDLSLGILVASPRDISSSIVPMGNQTQMSGAQGHES